LRAAEGVLQRDAPCHQWKMSQVCYGESKSYSDLQRKTMQLDMVGQTSRNVLAYDASCGPCSRFKAVVGFLDARHRIEFESLEEADRAGLLESVAPSLRYGSFHLVAFGAGSSGGESRSGSKAILPLARLLLPRGESILSLVEATPGLGDAISFVYSMLSRSHEVGSCKSAPHNHGLRHGQGRTMVR
jgi:predicted DCC family thiol-disulfide oxidoreductase YuxK